MESEKTYTQAEVDDLLQKETDRRVTSALKKQSESLKLESMDTQEKANYEIEQKEKELAQREKALALNEQKLSAIKILNEQKLPIALADYCVNEDAKITNENIKSIGKIFNDAIADGIKSRIGIEPKSANKDNGAITIDYFRKMTIAQQSDLAKNQPEVYSQLTK